MRAKTVGALSALGMFLTSLTVFSVTPDGGFAIAATDDAGAASLQATVPLPGGAASGASLGHFLVEEALRIEGRVGHAAIQRGDRAETYVLLEIAGTKDAVAPPKAADGHLAIVLDQSGSMRGSRLANAKAAALRAIEGLRDGDMVSVVTFDTRTRVAVPPTVLSASTRNEVATSVRRIGLGGDTCISCGVEAALGELGVSSRTKRMLVLSDGDANHGLRDVQGFRGLGQRAVGQGVEITTVGVSLAYNELFLGALAETGGGRHYFAEDDAGLANVFEQEARFSSNTVASQAEVEIELAPGVELDRVFDRSFTRSGSRLRIPVGAFAQGEQKTVLLKVRMAAASSEGTLPIATTRVRYHDAIRGAAVETERPLGAALVEKRDEASPLDGVVVARLQRVETAALLEDASALARQGKLAEARKQLERGRIELGTRAKEAKASAPSTRSAGVDADLQSQSKVLEEAEQAFAAPPPDASPTPQPARQAADPFAGPPPAKSPRPAPPSGGGKKAQESVNAFRR